MIIKALSSSSGQYAQDRIMFQGFLTQSLEKLNGLRCSPAQNIMTANKSAPQTAGSLTVICRGPSDFTVNFFTWLKYHDSYVPRIG